MLLLWFLGFAATFVYLTWLSFTETSAPGWLSTFWHRGMYVRAVAFFILVMLILSIVSALWFIAWPFALYQKYTGKRKGFTV